MDTKIQKPSKKRWKISSPLTLIVDLDGTLIHTFPDLYLSAISAIRKGKIPLPDHEISQIEPFAGKGARGILRAILQSDPPESLVAEMLNEYGKIVGRYSYPYPGVEEWFSLGEVWVVTNKPFLFAKPLLDRFFSGLYKGPITPELVSGEKKPSPRMYAKVLSCTSSSFVFVVGDDPRDYEAARDLSLSFLIAEYGYYPEGSWENLQLPRLPHPKKLKETILQLARKTFVP